MARIAAVVADLMLASRVRTSLEASGHEVEEDSRLPDELDGIDLVVADLDAVSPEQLADLEVPVIGFYQHTDTRDEAACRRRGACVGCAAEPDGQGAAGAGRTGARLAGRKQAGLGSPGLPALPASRGRAAAWRCCCRARTPRPRSGRRAGRAGLRDRGPAPPRTGRSGPDRGCAPAARTRGSAQRSAWSREPRSRIWPPPAARDTAGRRTDRPGTPGSGSPSGEAGRLRHSRRRWRRRSCRRPGRRPR